MATTTNFGWETPDDTDLVKDGAAAIRTALNGVDTSFLDLKGGTTGQLLSKNSATNLDYIWVDPSTGDITGVTAGTGISGGGTSGTVTVTNSMATAITTAGDLIKGTGSGTFDRLGIGSAGQVLTVTAGAPAWASASSPTDTWTLLNSGGTSLTSTAVNITGISGQNELMIEVYNCSVTSGSQYPINITFNADGANHNYFLGYIDAPSTYAAANTGSIGQISAGNVPIATTGGNASSVQNGIVHIMGANSTGAKPFTVAGGSTSGGNNGQRNVFGGGVYNGSSTISSVRISMADTFDGGTIYVYGRS